jgi:hypothetical protein
MSAWATLGLTMLTTKVATSANTNPGADVSPISDARDIALRKNCAAFMSPPWPYSASKCEYQFNYLLYSPRCVKTGQMLRPLHSLGLTKPRPLWRLDRPNAFCYLAVTYPSSSCQLNEFAKFVSGEMAEWLKAHAWNACILAIVS